MDKLKLTRIGKNWNGYMAYKDEAGRYYADINYIPGQIPERLYELHPSDDMDGEAGWPIKDFEIVNPESEREALEEKFSFSYMMLDKLRESCGGFLSSGDCRYKRFDCLCGKTIESHIKEMKELWQKFPEDLKPKWCTWEDILDYEKKMLELIA